MKLYDLSDKEFDTFFKKAANSAEYPFSELAWKGMEKRLDRWERYMSFFWKFLGGSIILLLGVLSSLIYLSPADPDNLSAENQQYRADSEIIEKNISPEIPALIEDNRNQQQSISSNDEEIETVGDQNKFLNPTSELLDIHKSKQESYIFKEEIHQTNVINEEDKFVGQGNDILIQKIEGLQIPATTKINTDYLLTIKKSSPEEIIIPEKSTYRTGYSLNFIIGPDFSGVSSNNYGTGTFIGLGFEAYLLKNLSLFAGISHSRKKYDVYDEYTAPYPGIWTNGQVPDEVEIACHVLDIPINVYYSVFNANKNRIFIGAGLSSYLMLTEEYSFKYDYSYDPDLIKDYLIKNENQHYFGIVNLSAGYTRYVNNRWAWQIEPYYKLPIQDIAAAKVRLKSFGALISLKYRFR